MHIITALATCSCSLTSVYETLVGSAGGAAPEAPSASSAYSYVNRHVSNAWMYKRMTVTQFSVKQSPIIQDYN